MPNFRIKIRTLSPVHVGDGGFYDGMTAFEYKRKYIPLNQAALISAFKESGIEIRDFTKWVITSKEDREYRKPRINDFIRYQYNDKMDQFAEALLETQKYQLENLSVTRINSDVNTCMKNMYNLPYLPGSAIKGAMVTAILFNCLKNDEDFKKELNDILEENYDFLSEVYESLKEMKDLTERKKDLGFKNYKEIGIPREQQRDFRRILTMRERPLKFIRQDLEQRMGFHGNRLDEICDMIQEWRDGDKKTYRNLIRQEKRKYDNLKISIISKQLKNLEEKFKNKYLAAKDNDLYKLMRFLQIGDSSSPVPQNGSPALSKVTNCLIIHQNPRITMNLFFEMIDTNEILYSKFRLESNKLVFEHITFPEHSKRFIDIEYLKKRIYEFSNRVIQEDSDYIERLSGYNYRFPINEIKMQLDDLQKRNRPQAPVLRVGKGQGFLSLTLALLIKDFMPEVYSKLIGVVQSDKNDPDKYPVTRRILTDGSGKYKLPGWLKLNFEEDEHD